MLLEELNSTLKIPCYRCRRSFAVVRAQIIDGEAIVTQCLCAQCANKDEVELLDRRLI